MLLRLSFSLVLFRLTPDSDCRCTSASRFCYNTPLFEFSDFSFLFLSFSPCAFVSLPVFRPLSLSRSLSLLARNHVRVQPPDVCMSILEPASRWPEQIVLYTSTCKEREPCMNSAHSSLLGLACRRMEVTVRASCMSSDIHTKLQASKFELYWCLGLSR
ncbi:hypothetical protein C8Q74DRAFT_611429 [Fomes fomentarius]|nr:hypothetical protein C8Q74DRAFT_611429 [Fomes fomentarius]